MVVDGFVPDLTCDGSEPLYFLPFLLKIKAASYLRGVGACGVSRGVSLVRRAGGRHLAHQVPTSAVRLPGFVTGLSELSSPS